MRILIYLYAFEAGGAQRRILTLANSFYHAGHDMAIAVVDNTGVLQSELPGDMQVHVLGSALPRRLPGMKTRSARLLGAVFRLARLIKREKPDIVLAGANHVILSSLLAYRMAVRDAYTTQLVLRFSNTLSGDRKRFSLTRPLKIALFRRFVACSGALIAVSRNVAKDVAKRLKIRCDQFHVLPNPVINARLSQTCEQGPEHNWLKNHELPVILGVGRLNAQKDFATLIKAFALVREKKKARLVIYGEGEERPRLQHIANNCDNPEDIDLAGYHSCPWREMAHADMLVLSSCWEGLPGVLIEAMAVGCPVVSTDCPGGSREILQDGELGPLVPVGDTQAMAEAIEKVFTTPCDHAALRQAATHYDVETAAQAYLGLFSRVYGAARDNGV